MTHKSRLITNISQKCRHFVGGRCKKVILTLFLFFIVTNLWRLTLIRSLLISQMLTTGVCLFACKALITIFFIISFFSVREWAEFCKSCLLIGSGTGEGGGGGGIFRSSLRTRADFHSNCCYKDTNICGKRHVLTNCRPKLNMEQKSQRKGYTRPSFKLSRSSDSNSSVSSPNRNC